MDNKYIETVINFGGFYESNHSYTIDSTVERFLDGRIEYENETNNTNKDDSDYDFDYKSMHENYINQWSNEFESYLLNEYGLNISFSNLKLHSPKYYNYETDSIHCNMLESDYQLLKNYFINDANFDEYLKKATQSYSGYHSFYTYESALNARPEILSQYIFDYVLYTAKQNDNYFDDDIYIEALLESDKELV